MKLAALLASILSLACASSKPAAQTINPETDPTAIAAVAAATEEAAAAAQTGRRIGKAVGVVAAVLGGPESESLDDAIDRDRLARDAGETIGAVVGATKGAKSGAKRGFEFDKQMAELEKIEELDVTRPAPYVIVVQFDDPQTKHLADIARIVAGRTIDIVAAGDAAAAVRDALASHGAPASTLHSVRSDEARSVTLHIYMGDS